MFIAMNRFKVHKGSERDFEQVWLTRQTHLEQVPGFMVFHLLKGPEKDDHVLYASHSVWRSQKHFEAGRGRTLSAKPMPALVPASRSISAIPNSRASPSFKK
jgi:heme-degrading monooxygenase HmoA